MYTLNIPPSFRRSQRHQYIFPQLPPYPTPEPAPSAPSRPFLESQRCSCHWSSTVYKIHFSSVCANTQIKSTRDWKKKANPSVLRDVKSILWIWNIFAYFKTQFVDWKRLIYSIMIITKSIHLPHFNYVHDTYVLSYYPRWIPVKYLHNLPDLT